MDISVFTNYFMQYGGLAIFIIVFLEYMNLPGFPAGIIMPLAGVFASRGDISFPMVMLLSVAAGLLGSITLYCLGYFGGDLFLKKYLGKFPSQKDKIEKNIIWLQRKGCVGVFIAKLLPMVRTLISIPAGVIKMNMFRYCISSLLGIFIWNLLFIGAGYELGEAYFSYFIPS